ncbi:hypothetical protein Pelo_1396 [Pelomyxa schiedti]|nr:hypothetical protein Pelo_1396 [Pelomyxa schiedti]
MKAIVALLLVGLALVVAQQACTYTTVGTNGETLQYDLSPLTLTGENYMIQDEKNNKYLLNICANATSGCTPAQAVCQQASNTRYYGCGILSTQKITDGESGPDSGVTVWYGEGTSCSGLIDRATTIYIGCSPDTETVVYDVMEASSCQYSIWMKSKYACPL